MRAWALLAVCILLFSGCTDDDSDVQSAETPDTDTTPVVPEEILPAATEETTAKDLTGITEFYWATNATLPGLAFELTFDFGKENPCTLLTGTAGRTDEPGPHSVFTYDAENGNGWSSGSSGSTATLRSPVLDTWDVTGGDGGHAGGSGLKGRFDGTMTLTTLTPGVEAVPEFDDFTGGHSLAIQATCERPFDVTGARAGYETRLADETSMDDGVGYYVFLATQGGVQSGFQHEITVGDGYVRTGSFGYQVGRVVLTAPKDSNTLILPEESEGMLQGGPGAYSVTVDRAGVYFQAFWSAVYGLSHDVDLSAGLQDGPVLEDPFA